MTVAEPVSGLTPGGRAVPAAPRRAVRRRRPGPGVLAAWAVLLLLLVAAVWPDLLAPHSPYATDPINALGGPDRQHPFGTDQLGRDVLSRVVHGARPSLEIGLGATAIAVGVGALAGVLAATGGRIVDEAVMRVADVFLALPGLLFAMLVVAVIGPSTLNATLAIGLSMAPGFARLARGQAMTVRESDYVRAAVVLGRPVRSVRMRHLLPNALPPLLVLATLNVGTAIIAGSSLSFLGLGPRPPAPEWGAMLSQARDFLDIAWATAVFPGLAITLTVIAFTVAGGDLRRRLDGAVDTTGRT